MWDNDKSRAVDSYDYKVSPNPNDNCVCGSRSYIKLIIIHCTTYSIATRVFFPPFCFSFFYFHNGRTDIHCGYYAGFCQYMCYVYVTPNCDMFF